MGWSSKFLPTLYDWSHHNRYIMGIKNLYLSLYLDQIQNVHHFLDYRAIRAVISYEVVAAGGGLNAIKTHMSQVRAFCEVIEYYRTN